MNLILDPHFPVSAKSRGCFLKAFVNTGNWGETNHYDHPIGPCWVPFFYGSSCFRLVWPGSKQASQEGDQRASKQASKQASQPASKQSMISGTSFFDLTATACGRAAMNFERTSTRRGRCSRSNNNNNGSNNNQNVNRSMPFKSRQREWPVHLWTCSTISAGVWQGWFNPDALLIIEWARSWVLTAKQNVNWLVDLKHFVMLKLLLAAWSAHWIHQPKRSDFMLWPNSSANTTFAEDGDTIAGKNRCTM